ncbi:DUF6388 family protein [Pseudomonas sp. P2757]|uniref:DUF6388 family protein n=1 Tax=unclassified Pseudomonas TaxID=196821 RepID=UPI003B59119F
MYYQAKIPRRIPLLEKLMNSDDLRRELALSKFFNGNSSLNDDVKGLNQVERKLCIESAFEQEATRLGIEVWELTLFMISESSEELKHLTLEFHREVAEMVEMDWEEYCKLNGISE